MSRAPGPPAAPARGPSFPPVPPPPVARPLPENVLIWALDRLESMGFERRGVIWCRVTEETLFAFEFRRTRGDERYRMFAGLTLLRLHGRNLTHHSPLACDLAGQFRLRFLDAALDFSRPFAGRRTKELATLVDEFILPAANASLTARGALEFSCTRAPFGVLGAFPLPKRFLDRLRRAQASGRIPKSVTAGLSLSPNRY